MTKPNDGTIPAGQEPEGRTGTGEISWQSAMDAAPENATEAASPATEMAVPATTEAPQRETPGTHAAEAAGGVDFVLAETTATDASTDASADASAGASAGASTDASEAAPAGEATSAFGDKAGEADSLWASLGAKPSSEPVATAAEENTTPGAGADYGFDTAPDTASISADGNAAAKAPGKADPKAKGKGKKQTKPRVPSMGPFGGKSLGPVLPSQAMMLDGEGNLVPTPPTMSSRLFTALALIPVLVPILLFLVQVVFTLDTRSLWYSDEVRYASAYRSMVDTADWLVLHLNGAVYPDKPPLFFWFLYGLDGAAKLVLPLIPFSITMTDSLLFFTGMAVSGLLCLLAAHALASFVGRVDRRTVLAADCILLSGFFFAGLAHYLRMDLLFTAFITISHVFLFHAFVRDKAPLLMLLGFLCAGAAVLVKGPLGFAFPLLAVLCFLLWQGRILRFFKVDSLFGLLVGLAVPCVWLALAKMNAGDAFFDNILNKQILARALDTWHHGEPWYHYLWSFPLIWLPWTLAFFFLPWGRFMGKGMRSGLKASRTKDGAGIAYLWCAFLPGFVLLSAVSIKIPIYCLPLFPPLAILTARAVLRMRPFASAWLQYSLAIVLALLGLALVVLPAVPGTYLPLPYVPKGVMVLGGICMLFAVMLGFLVKPRRTEGAVLLMALFTTALAWPMWTVTAPSLDAFLSPKAQAEVISEYRAAGYAPATFKVYAGTYTYYAGNTHDCETWEAALAFADKNPKTVLALQAKFWDKLEAKPEGFHEVNRQIIAERAYVLVARPPLPGNVPQTAEAPGPVTTEAGEAAPQAAPDAAAPSSTADTASSEGAADKGVPETTPQPGGETVSDAVPGAALAPDTESVAAPAAAADVAAPGASIPGAATQDARPLQEAAPQAEAQAGSAPGADSGTATAPAVTPVPAAPGDAASGGTAPSDAVPGTAAPAEAAPAS